MPAANLTGRSYYTVTGTTSKLLKKGFTFGTSYGDGGHASGSVYVDKVAVGSATATSQAVEAATSVSSGYISNRDIDGMLGMGFTDANSVRPTQQNTFFDSVKTSLVKPLFAVTFKHSAAGSLDFGYINSTKYTGKLSYAPVDASSGYWKFPLRRYGINGTNYNYGVNFDAIVDTGTTLMYLPDNIVKLYYSKVPGAAIDTSIGAWTFPCTSTPPPLGLFVNGTKYTVPGKFINWQSGLANNHCWGGLQSSANLPFAILGSVFLKAVYAVFDESTGSARIGIAKQA
ncbi:acid protease [Myriangium duriaei CBS 260.36]|uniref:Acid protease n=1 Tax=Myriangium duriaei CBS 260.36 TaxID=1168546 RepID=A0A9P4IYN0_9PEZI|nr:acid protease [Myriangium duriaei CBS 260.36]